MDTRGKLARASCMSSLLIGTLIAVQLIAQSASAPSPLKREQSHILGENQFKKPSYFKTSWRANKLISSLYTVI